MPGFGFRSIVSESHFRYTDSRFYQSCVLGSGVSTERIGKECCGGLLSRHRRHDPRVEGDADTRLL